MILRVVIVEKIMERIMNKYLIKIGLFFAFCIVSVVIIACSDEFIASNLNDGEEIATTDQLEKVSGCEVVYGYRDSVPVLMLTLQGEDYLKKTNIDSTDSLRPYRNALHRTREFNLKWNSVDGADNYEVRVYRKPITKDNWYRAQAVEILSLNENDGKINAKMILNPIPEVKSGRCTGCGKCYESCPTGAISMSGGKAIINNDKCIECGECFRGCEYDAIIGTFPGTAYYVAIRSINSDGEYSEEVAEFPGPIKLRYTIISEIPDTDKDPQIQTIGGCIGNCNLEGCFIVFPQNSICKSIDGTIEKRDNDQLGDSLVSVCPVDAIFEIDSADVDTAITEPGAIFIDKDKCINCGRCVMQCWADGPYGSVTSEIVKAVSRIF